MEQVIIIGGGAAGMMAAISLAEQGYKPTLIEKNDKLGKKLFITGKGRCNLTNNCQVDELLKNVVTNDKFMYSSFYGFDARQTIEWFEANGLPTKTERGNRVFPISDHSSDVLRTLENRMRQLGVNIFLQTEVTELLYDEYDSENQLESESISKNKYEKCISGVLYRTKDGSKKTMKCTRIIVATGGLSYPQTGSTGDGFRWAKELGLRVADLHPALVPMCAREGLCKELMGLTLKNVRISFIAKVKNKDKLLYKDHGELLFTHFGVSGPIVLSASSYVYKYIKDDLRLVINMKPALTREQLDLRVLRDFSKNQNKDIRNALDELLPKRMIEYVIEAASIDPYKKVHEINKAERVRLIDALTEFTIHITDFRDYPEAIITQGGLSVKEVNPQTMEVKRVKGLYYIGEVLDVDALTGGFNLQIAWSTARCVCIEK
ncbi:MAG: NAD(P)/FAD-dependent oxidoreductase [Eubacteriales bacterium]|nr:NAD(P)/FAD-dependent oxidoreductase [Eubacteriales bacterium]